MNTNIINQLYNTYIKTNILTQNEFDNEINSWIEYI